MYYGFESEEELSQAVEAWRKMEGIVRRVQAGVFEGNISWVDIYDMLTSALRPLDDLDKAAGMKALGGL